MRSQYYEQYLDVAFIYAIWIYNKMLLQYHSILQFKMQSVFPVERPVATLPITSAIQTCAKVGLVSIFQRRI